MADKNFFEQFKAWWKAAPKPQDDDDDADTEPDDDTDDVMKAADRKAAWEEIFNETDSQEDDAEDDDDETDDDDEAEKGKPKAGGAKEPPKAKENDMADKNADELRLEYDNKMKAVLAQNAELARRLDEKDMGAWFEEQLRAGKVAPAERDAIVQMALQLKADDAASHPTMKSADGGKITRLAAYQASIEARQPMFEFRDNQLKGAGFDDARTQQTELSDARKAQLLAASAVGEKILQERNGKH